MIDIHAHIRYENGEYDINSMLKDMDMHGISKRVISSFNGLPIQENNRNINRIVSMHPDRFLGCAIINPKQDDSIEATMEAIKLKHIYMFEFNPVYHGYFPDLIPSMDRIISLIVEAKKPIKVFTGIGQHGIPQQWEKYLVKYPSLKIIFLHMGCFDYGYTCIDVVKRNDNAYTEISNQYESQILRKCLREIPVSKILFGSSFPERLTSSSLIILDMLDIDEEYKRQIYNNNNRCFLGVGKDE